METIKLEFDLAALQAMIPKGVTFRMIWHQVPPGQQMVDFEVQKGPKVCSHRSPLNCFFWGSRDSQRAAEAVVHMILKDLLNL